MHTQIKEVKSFVCGKKCRMIRDINMHWIWARLRTGFLNCALTSSMTFFVVSILPVICSSSPILNMDESCKFGSAYYNRFSSKRVAQTCENIGPSFDLKDISFPMPLSSKEGKDSNRSVCPVGAVSNTITENCIVCTSLNGRNLRRKKERGIHTSWLPQNSSPHLCPAKNLLGLAPSNCLVGRLKDFRDLLVRQLDRFPSVECSQ